MLLSFTLTTYLSGCATTKPNTPYAGSYPQSFNGLSTQNPLLANELGKLPEIQDGISDSEKIALEQLVLLYESYPDEFDAAFNEMYKIGLPEYRKYCSPLQALFWIVEDGSIEKANKVIKDYSLRSLLFEWLLERKRLLSENQANELIDLIKDKRTKTEYFELYHKVSNYQFLVYYSEDLKKKSSLFKKGAKKALKNMTYLKNSRWGDFSTVMDRLNAPELLHYYINNNIYYKKNRTNSHTPKHTFLYHWGDCDDLAVFGKYILNKGGYKVDIRYVHWTSDNRGHVGVVIKLDDGRYYIAVDFGWKNRMSGPYTKISEIDKILSGGGFFHDSGWWRQPR